MRPIHKVRVTKINRGIIFEGQYIRRIVWRQLRNV
jgi:hypothetical protein